VSKKDKHDDQNFSIWTEEFFTPHDVAAVSVPEHGHPNGGLLVPASNLDLECHADIKYVYGVSL
jgi:hypothetical protein